MSKPLHNEEIAMLRPLLAPDNARWAGNAASDEVYRAIRGGLRSELARRYLWDHLVANGRDGDLDRWKLRHILSRYRHDLTALKTEVLACWPVIEARPIEGITGLGDESGSGWLFSHKGCHVQLVHLGRILFCQQAISRYGPERRWEGWRVGSSFAYSRMITLVKAAGLEPAP